MDEIAGMNTNGTTKSNGRRCNDCLSQTESVIMGETSINSIQYGIESLPISGENRIGGNFDWKLTPVRDTTAGKILERLESLEAQTLSYIHSHQARLEARLGESKQLEEEFLRESNQIKGDIYHLAVAQQENEIGDGD